MAGGRPTKFTKEIKKQIKSLVLLGLTDKQVAEGVGVCEDTITNWKKDHPKFFVSLKDWKDEADRKVEKSLYERACGFSHEETKVMMQDGEIIDHKITKHHPPDPTSMIFWLKNRHPDRWRDKQEVELSGKVVKLVKKKFDGESHD